MKFNVLFLLAAVLISSVSAEYVGTASGKRNSDGKWIFTFYTNDWQSNPQMAVQEPNKAGELITFNSELTMGATVFINGKQYRKGNDRLPTVNDWSSFKMEGTMTEPSGVTNGEFKVRLYGYAQKGDARSINGAVHLNQKDPAYTPQGYELICNIATGIARPAK
jgi:hypothetical protein